MHIQPTNTQNNTNQTQAPEQQRHPNHIKFSAIYDETGAPRAQKVIIYHADKSGNTWVATEQDKLDRQAMIEEDFRFFQSLEQNSGQ